MKYKSIIFCLFGVALSVTLAFKIPLKEDVTGSCVKCHATDPNKINVHLVHHSHDDVGWLKTLDQYFWGLNSSIVNVGVQYIISSVVNALWEHPDRRFIQVETAFFWKWWRDQDEMMRNRFRSLVENGQLEIINGGWVMNDEACVNYQSTIDQFTWGFKILGDTLGECGRPTIGWQIDPFGHSREHASILNKMGFDGLFFARLDNNDREKRKIDQNMDFLWQTSASNDDSTIFGGMFGPDNIYYPPSGFCFDVLCGDDSIDDDPDDDSYNVEEKAATFAEYAKNYTAYFKTNNVLVTMGGDFQYQAAEINFANSDRLIRAFQNNTEINLIYSTPSCYLKAVYESQPALTIKTDDFFPYGSADHSYWAGYFTSRQNFKRFERVSHNILQISKQLTALAVANKQNDTNVELLKGLREAIGVVQHHDSITGTAKQHVSEDYTKILSRAVSQAQQGFSSIIGQLLNFDLLSNTTLSSCLLANMSICNTTQSADEFIVVVYNPLSWTVSYPIRVPVENNSFTVQGSEGAVSHDVLTPISDFAYVELDNDHPAKNDLVFIATDIPPLGIKVYHVSNKSDSDINGKSNKEILKDDLYFGDEKTGFEIDSSTNRLKSVTMNGVSLNISQQFLYYASSAGFDGDSSGAYIFRPIGEAVPFDNATIISTMSGTVVDEVHQKINDWITQIIRVYKGSENYIEFDWLVGPLDFGDTNGIEVISRFTVANFDSNQTFYTDSNGRENIERRLNYRPTYSYNSTFEPIASNYYPVTSKILIKDEVQNLQVAVLNERSQGGSSLENGQIELMVHRRTLFDDSKGVGEPLNELEFENGIIARGQHYLIIGSSDNDSADNKSTTAQERIFAQRKLLQPWVGFGDSSKLSDDTVQSLLKVNYSALTQSLPENVNLLTFEPWNNSSYLLRLEHIFEKDEDAALSSSVSIDLANIFADFTVSNVVEYTLGANRRLDSMKSGYDWSYSGLKKNPQSSLTATTVSLSPMDIKTFIVELAN